MRRMILLIDNYDSFTFNLYHFLGEVGAQCDVWRNDKITVEAVLALKPEAIVLSPGPCTPNEAGICLDLIVAAAGKIPLLGVCLGHQSIGQAFGGLLGRLLRDFFGHRCARLCWKYRKAGCSCITASAGFDRVPRVVHPLHACQRAFSSSARVRRPRSLPSACASQATMASSA